MGGNGGVGKRGNCRGGQGQGMDGGRGGGSGDGGINSRSPFEIVHLYCMWLEGSLCG